MILRNQTATVTVPFIHEPLTNSKVLEGFRLRLLKNADIADAVMPRQSTSSTDNNTSPTRIFPCKALLSLIACTIGNSLFGLSSTKPSKPAGATTVKRWKLESPSLESPGEV
mmetsp:Transcript_32805/g.68995  ORF Transcript_32805/g.68995 Transcript_32805/m.68995 type:complete len:112 (+) Transcript_32805:160-495(+)